MPPIIPLHSIPSLQNEGGQRLPSLRTEVVGVKTTDTESIQSNKRKRILMGAAESHTTKAKATDVKPGVHLHVQPNYLG